MKVETKNKIFWSVFIIAIIFIFLFLIYYEAQPDLRNVSYYNDDNYYMVNAITGSNGSSPDGWHWGAIKKEDYDAWENGTATTVWIVDSQNEKKGWRLRCNTISTIIIYDREHLPSNF